MNIKKILALFFVIGALFLAFFGYHFYKIMFKPNTDFSKPIEEIYIRTGSSFDDVYKQLRPFLKNDESFLEVAKQKKYIYNVKSGRYILKKGMSNFEIINVLRSKNEPVKISFNNQERIENLAGRIATQIEADSISLLKAFTNEKFLNDNKIDIKNVISLFIPNTYEVYWDISPEQFSRKMAKEYHKFWNEKRREKAKEQNLTPQQVMVLASIVQKETTKIDERPRVAGVYLNRLKDNQLLQADPTAIYGVKEQIDRYDTIIKRVLYKHIEVDSPYNTYKYLGLPPGPITMPDISSIEAVLNPEKHQFYFFVADNERPGYHIFAKTYQQHLRNREQYIRWLQENNIK